MSKTWDNQAIQKDPEGYLAWQREQKGKAEREAKQKRDEADFQQFKALFLERGGAEKDARELYDRYRNDRAFEQAKQLDQEATNRMRSDRSRMV
jgi:hypothetical protein